MTKTPLKNTKPPPGDVEFFTRGPTYYLRPGDLAQPGEGVDQMGVVANAAFLDLVDSHLGGADCLCGYAAPSARAARRVGREIRHLLAFYRQESYAGSRQRERLAEAARRDALPSECRLAARARGRRSGGTDPRLAAQEAGLRALAGVRGVAPALAGPGCREAGDDVLGAAGAALFLYSTAEARRLLRRLSKAAAAAGFALRARAGAPPLCLRHKLRVYRVHVYPATEGDKKTPADFWRFVAATLAGRD